jgi:hypothetical protein
MSTAPLFARDTTAARLLDMPPARFRTLVNQGALPAPCHVAGEKRWDVEELQSVMRGVKLRPTEGLDL